MFKSIPWILVLSLGWAPAAFAEDAPPQPYALWSNAGHELLNLAASPAQGTWPGYALALGWGGAVYAGFKHDLDWYRAVQDRRDPVQDKIMPVATLCGDGWLHVGAYAALYQFGDAYDQQVAAQAVEGQIDVAVVSVLAKFAFSATRPGEDDSQRHWFSGTFNDASFPSGHAMTAFCSAAIVGRAYHVEWLTFPLAAAVAYSRVYNQKHWPSDVLAGAGLGTLIGYTVLAWQDQRPEQEPAIRFTVLPTDNGAQVVASWRY